MAKKHLSLQDFSPDNYKLYIEKPDKNFSKERNYAVIDQVLKENAEMQIKVDDQVKKAAGNVADILAHFAKYKLDIGGGKQIEQYLGKHWMSKIYGEKLIEKIKMREEIVKHNRAKGNTKFLNYYLK